MANEMPGYETILRNFRERRGLYILGAGVSAGTAPFGKGFWTEATIDHLRNSRSFPVVVPVHSELSQGMIDHSLSLSMPEIFPDREMRYGSEEFPLLEILHRMPDYSARLYMKYRLSAFRFSGRQSESYGVFQWFYPSMISNYTLFTSEPENPLG